MCDCKPRVGPLLTRFIHQLRPMLPYEIIGAGVGYYVAPKLGFSTSTGLIVGFLVPPAYNALDVKKQSS